MWLQLTGSRVYLDANILIYAVEANPQFLLAASALMQAVDSRFVQAVNERIDFSRGARETRGVEKN